VIVILKPCRKEIEAFPEEIRGDLADALARLDAFKKTTQATSARNLELARTRLKEVRS
jgi:phage-related protein